MTAFTRTGTGEVEGGHGEQRVTVGVLLAQKGGNVGGRGEDIGDTLRTPLTDIYTILKIFWKTPQG